MTNIDIEVKKPAGMRVFWFSGTDFKYPFSWINREVFTQKKDLYYFMIKKTISLRSVFRRPAFSYLTGTMPQCDRRSQCVVGLVRRKTSSQIYSLFQPWSSITSLKYLMRGKNKNLSGPGWEALSCVCRGNCQESVLTSLRNFDTINKLI